MLNLNNVKTIYLFFTKKLFKSKKTKFFILFSFFPLIIFLLVNGIKAVNHSSPLEGSVFFARGGMSFFFQLYIQLVSLLFGGSVLGDEIESKTLIYLQASPASKLSVLTGKFLSYFTVSFSSFFLGSTSLYVVTNFNNIFDPGSMKTLAQLEFAGFLSILAYSSFFMMLGALLKKSTILGVFFIFGWEGLAQILPGAAQKMTIIYYMTSIIPIELPRGRGPFNFWVERLPYFEAVLMLLFISTLFFAATAYIFYRKEYVLADHS
ncbi:MAG: hypothetical protein ABFR75_05290 [Acidobacteriota bacterium]